MVRLILLALLIVATPAWSGDRLIVRYEKGAIAELPVGAKRIRRLSTGAELIDVPSNRSAALLRELRLKPGVAYADVDRRIFPLFTPNDTQYSSQWNLTGVYGVKAPAAWDINTGTGQVVAVLDTGSTTHADLNANEVAGYDFIADVTAAGDSDGRDANPADVGDFCASPASDSSWHGTHIAGIVAAVTNNATGVAGLAHGAKVQHARVLGRCGGFESDAIDALTWAIGGTVTGVPANATPVGVVNMSFGTTGACSASMQAAINAALVAGVPVVVAAGNDNVDVSTVSPANCLGVITVGATTSGGVRSSFSNHGAGITLGAPGSSILSTHNDGTTVVGSATYTALSGTSMAAPHVSATIAMMRSYASAQSLTITPEQIRGALVDSVTGYAIPQSPALGQGIVNAEGALKATISTLARPIGRGQPVKDVTATAGRWIDYRFEVPTGATALTVTAAKPTIGNADLYLRAGQLPNLSTYDCAPRLDLEDEVCTISSPAAGVWYARLVAYSTFGGGQLKVDFDDAQGASAFTYATPTAIADRAVTNAPLTISRTGYGSTTTRVSVDILHTYIGDLKVQVVTPAGQTYTLHNGTGGAAGRLVKTYSINTSTRPTPGEWTLRVTDSRDEDVGVINSWSIVF